MKLPSFKRIYSSDFPDQPQGFIEKLAFIINNGVEVLYNTLNNRVSLSDNIFCDVATLEVEVDANGLPKKNLNFTLNKLTKTSVVGCEVIRANNSTNQSVYPTSGVMLSYTQNGDILSFQHVTGLPTGNTFVLTVIIYGL